jgi:hypothetical protein
MDEGNYRLQNFCGQEKNQWSNERTTIGVEEWGELGVPDPCPPESSPSNEPRIGVVLTHILLELTKDLVAEEASPGA